MYEDTIDNDVHIVIIRIDTSVLLSSRLWKRRYYFPVLMIYSFFCSILLLYFINYTTIIIFIIHEVSMNFSKMNLLPTHVTSERENRSQVQPKPIGTDMERNSHRRASKVVYATLTVMIAGALCHVPTAQAAYGEELYTHIHRSTSEETVTKTETSYVEHTSTSTTDIIKPHVGLNLPRISKSQLKEAREALGYIDLRESNRLAEYSYFPIKEQNLYAMGVLAKFKDGNRWGIIDTTGTVTIPAHYKELKELPDGTFLAGKDKKQLDHIDKHNKKLGDMTSIPSDWLQPTSKTSLLHPATNLVEYTRQVSTWKGTTVADALLTSVLNDESFETTTRYGAIFHGIKRGYKDDHGNVIIDAHNDKVYPMTQYGTIVVNQGLTKFVSPTGKVLIQPDQYMVGRLEPREGLLALQKTTKDGYAVFDLHTGKALTDFNFTSLLFLGHDRMSVRLGESHYLAVASTGKLLKKWSDTAIIRPFDNTPYTWSIDGKERSIIDVDGNTLYTSHNTISGTNLFKNGYSPARQGKKWGIIKPDGTWLVPPTHDKIVML